MINIYNCFELKDHLQEMVSGVKVFGISYLFDGVESSGGPGVIIGCDYPICNYIHVPARGVATTEHFLDRIVNMLRSEYQFGIKRRG